jgi:hypothetical protein
MRLFRIRIALVVTASVLLFAFVTDSGRIIGKYEYANGYDYHYIQLKPDHAYYKDNHGCTYGLVTKGKWSLNSDTLTLSRTHSKKRRSNGPFKWCMEVKEKYLVRKDSLIELRYRDSGAPVRTTILKRK